MKTRLIQLIAGLFVMVLCISTCTTTTNAAVIWEDDFSDPNLPGWTLYGYENSSSPVMIDANFSATDGTLKVLDDKVNIARHNSNISVGTWSFDMYVPDGYDGAFYVQFLSNGTVSWVGATNNSHVSTGFYRDRFMVWREVGTSGSVIRDGIMDTVPGWHHVDVSRNSSSYFEVSINGTLRASFDYTGITSSTYLQIYSSIATGCAIDNLVVTIPDETPTPTTPPGGLGDITTLLIIAGVVVAAIVLIVVFARRR
ncbi:MAG: hypothetical protein ACFFE6_15090 [Candidatus Thorarchaeota archaeon]